MCAPIRSFVRRPLTLCMVFSCLCLTTYGEDSAAKSVISGNVTGVQSVRAPSWPSFRGPSGQGLATAELQSHWSETKNVTWKTAIPGKGWSSPVISDGRIWMTTAIETAAPEEEQAVGRKDKKQPNKRQLPEQISLRTVCVDVDSGKLLHDIELFSVEDPDPIHLLNSYASPTPVIEAGRLYCHFGTYGTKCISTESGEKIWEQRFPSEHAVGPGSSPVIWNDLLFLVCDGMEAQYVTALDKNSGQVVWKTDRPPMQGDDGDFHKAFSTPLVAEWDGSSQLLVPGAQWFVSYEPKTGDMLWHINHGKGFSNVAAPVFSDGVSYLITGFTKPELWAIPIGARGKLDSSQVLWEQKKQIPKKSSPILVGDEIYLISDNGVLSCVEADSGAILWVKRLGGNYSASPIHANGLLYFCSHEGKSTVVRANRERFEKIAENELDGQLMASPVASGSSLFVRSDKYLYRID